MLLSAMSVLVVAQSSSEFLEGLMNNPVLYKQSQTVDKGVNRFLSDLSKAFHCVNHTYYNQNLMFMYVQVKKESDSILCPLPFLTCINDLSSITNSHFTPRRYNPCRVLADSRSRLQSSLSLALLFLTPNFVTPSIHLRFGLPARLLPPGLSKVIFLHGRLSCIRITCPAHLAWLS